MDGSVVHLDLPPATTFLPSDHRSHPGRLDYLWIVANSVAVPLAMVTCIQYHDPIADPHHNLHMVSIKGIVKSTPGSNESVPSVAVSRSIQPAAGSSNNNNFGCAAKAQGSPDAVVSIREIFGYLMSKMLRPKISKKRIAFFQHSFPLVKRGSRKIALGKLYLTLKNDRHYIIQHG